MKALTICPRQKLMNVLAMISMETFYHTSQKPGTRIVNFDFRNGFLERAMPVIFFFTYVMFTKERLIKFYI